MHLKAESALATERDDYTTAIVPLSKRRGPFVMWLLWITMVTGFPSVLAGFDWFRQGLTLAQVLLCCLVSIAILMLYAVPACWLGADSGQTFPLLSRKLFGRYGSTMVSLNITFISVLWYGLIAYCFADGLKGMFHLPIDIMVLSAIVAVVMSFNNLFGFAGIANFAGYLAAPVLIIWVSSTFIRAGISCPPSLLYAPAHVSMSHALTMVSAFVIGYAAWGNEPDFWRFSKPRMSFTMIPIVVSLLIGAFMFPVTGWMLASLTGVTDYGAATALMTRYAFGGILAIAAVVLFVTYCAQNDANLYTAINGIANLKRVPRKRLALCLTAVGAICAALLSKWANSLEAVASMSATILPCPTVVMIAEWYVLPRLTKVKPDFSKVTDMTALPNVGWPAVISVLVGSMTGLLTSGVIPGSQRLHVGVCSLQAWFVTFAVYLPWRLIELKLVKPAACNCEPLTAAEPEYASTRQ
jgi:purine-cytosine permease-like protein